MPGVRGVLFVVVLTLAVIGLVAAAAAALLAYRKKRKKNATRALLHKYTLLEYANDQVAFDTKRNPIQPPPSSQVKVRLIASKPPPLKKQKIVYDESMDLSCEDEFKETNKTQATVDNTDDSLTSRPKEKLRDIFRHTKNSRSFNLGKRRSKPDVIDIGEYTPLAKRIPRPDSVCSEGLGTILYTLQYSVKEELLTVALISGRQIYSSDPSDIIKLPAVCIQIEGEDDSEVTSNPDDAPNPEYDQEFYFSLRPNRLSFSTLRFTVLDFVYSHEVRIIGFFKVMLAQHERYFRNGDVTPVMNGNINMSLNEMSLSYLGDILVSLLYDCVADKVNVTVRRLRQLQLQPDDQDVYVKISLLLDNDVIQSKRTTSHSCSRVVQIDQNFEFSALSDDLDKSSADNSPQERLAQELLAHTSQASKISLGLNDTRSQVNSSCSLDVNASDTLANNMGILISVRATTVAGKKRILGRVYIGRTDIPMTDQQLHWIEMLKNFDNHITRWHQLKLERL